MTLSYYLHDACSKTHLKNVLELYTTNAGLQHKPKCASVHLIGLKHIGIKKLFKLSNNGNIEDDKVDLLKDFANIFTP